MNHLGQIFFTSPSQLANHAGATKQPEDRRDWTGETLAETLRYARHGNPAHVASAEKIIDQIELEIATESTEWVHGLAGSRPDVPAYLAGQPECMISRRPCQLERAPITVWVDLCTSATIPATAIHQRGAGIIAFIMALIREGRAVQLHAITYSHGIKNDQTIVICRLPTNPLDLSAVANALAGGGFPRSLCYGIARAENGFNGRSAKKSNWHGSYNYRVAAIRAYALEGLAAPGDIIIPGMHGADPRPAPADWVNARLAEWRRGEA